MRILIAEDDLMSRKFLVEFLSSYGECDQVIDGIETLDAYMIALKEKNPYSLVCLDIMIPKIDGVKVLKAIRDLETQKGILPEKRAKIIMISALPESTFVKKAYEVGCDAYIGKPIDTHKLIEYLGKLGLL